MPRGKSSSQAVPKPARKRPSAPAASDSGATYQMPPRAVAAMIDAAPTPHASVSPDRRYLLMLALPSFPSIVEVAAPERRLAGLRIDPRTNGPSRRNFLVGMTVQDLRDTKPRDRIRPITGLPKGARIADIAWAPTGARLAFTVTADDGKVTLWTADVAAARARQVSPRPLTGVAGRAYSWLPDGSGVIARFIPTGRGPEPEPPLAPAGPIIQESVTGRKAPARTYQDLLKNPHDEALLEHYLRAQMARVSLAGKITPIGKPELYGGFDPSPDGKYLLVSVLHRPFPHARRDLGSTRSARAPGDRFAAARRGAGGFCGGADRAALVRMARRRRRDLVLGRGPRWRRSETPGRSAGRGAVSRGTVLRAEAPQLCPPRPPVRRHHLGQR
ncbi:MAG TPA: hypothetical protein VGG33_19985 [Polyangia bacterium]